MEHRGFSGDSVRSRDLRGKRDPQGGDGLGGIPCGALPQRLGFGAGANETQQQAGGSWAGWVGGCCACPRDPRSATGLPAAPLETAGLELWVLGRGTGACWRCHRVLGDESGTFAPSECPVPLLPGRN